MYFVKWAIKKELKVFDLEDVKFKKMTPSVGEFSIGEFSIKKSNNWIYNYFFHTLQYLQKKKDIYIILFLSFFLSSLSFFCCCICLDHFLKR